MRYEAAFDTWCSSLGLTIRASGKSIVEDGVKTDILYQSTSVSEKDNEVRSYVLRMAEKSIGTTYLMQNHRGLIIYLYFFITSL